MTPSKETKDTDTKKIQWFKELLPYIIMASSLFAQYKIMQYDIDNIKSEVAEQKKLLENYKVMTFQVNEIYNALKPK
ncbi:MAG: hypothetical protein WCT77_00340 [Bacteroidota bacterium]